MLDRVPKNQIPGLLDVENEAFREAFYAAIRMGYDLIAVTLLERIPEDQVTNLLQGKNRRSYNKTLRSAVEGDHTEAVKRLLEYMQPNQSTKDELLRIAHEKGCSAVEALLWNYPPPQSSVRR